MLPALERSDTVGESSSIEVVTLAPACVDVVIVAHNRPVTLTRTLAELRRLEAVAGSACRLAVTVVDNASKEPIRVGDAGDGTREWLRLVRRADNAGVLAFNEGAALGRSEFLMILDDDAWPDWASFSEGLRILRTRSTLGAVAFHPTHPTTKSGEWAFAQGRMGCVAEGMWPLLGCGALVRRGAWEAVGGFEPGFFLYTNDTDLALRLIARGWGVHGDLSLIVWHDCETAARRPTRWFRMATRNRVWLARRHLPWAHACAAGAAGWLDAHRRAGVRAKDHAAALAGAVAGVFSEAPPIEPTQRCGPQPFRTLAGLLTGLPLRRPGG